jgi:DUF3079 family protein
MRHSFPAPLGLQRTDRAANGPETCLFDRYRGRAAGFPAAYERRHTVAAGTALGWTCRQAMQHTVEHPSHPERVCWGCPKYCPADDLACGSGTVRTQHPCELLGDDWMEWIERKTDPGQEPPSR